MKGYNEQKKGHFTWGEFQSEPLTHNRLVAGSNPAGPILRKRAQGLGDFE